jgi:hypothetical protein
MKDETALNTLHGMFDHFIQEMELHTTHRVVNQVLHKKRTNNEFILSVQIGDYDMDQVILDLGSNVNVFLKKTWEMMGKPKLIWSPVRLILANHHKIVPIGRLLRVPMNIYRVHNVADFKVIEIVDDTHAYQVLMGLEWDFEN